MNKMSTKVLLTIVFAAIMLSGAIPLTGLAIATSGPAPAQTSAGNGTYPIQFSDTGWNGPWKLLIEPQSREWLGGGTQYSMNNSGTIYLPPNQYVYTAYVMFPTWTMTSSGPLTVLAQNGTQHQSVNFLPGQMVYVHPIQVGNITWQSSTISAGSTSHLRGEHLQYFSTVDTLAGLMLYSTPYNGSTEEVELSPGPYHVNIMSEGGVFDGGAYFVVNEQPVYLNISMYMQNNRMDYAGTAANATSGTFWTLNVTHYVGIPGITETHFVTDQYLPSYSWDGLGTGYLNFTIIAPKGFILEETNITIYHYNVTPEKLLLGLQSNHSMHFSVNESEYNFSFYIGNSPQNGSLFMPNDSIMLISVHFIPVSTPSAYITASPTTIDLTQSTTVTLSITGGMPPYTWTLERNGSASNVTQATLSPSGFMFTPSVAGIYTLYFNVTDTAGKTSDSKITITVNPLPSASITASPTTMNLTQSATITLSITNGTSPYTWMFEENGSTGNMTSLGFKLGQNTFTPSVSGTYTLYFNVTDTAGKTSDSKTTITVVHHPTPVISSQVKFQATDLPSNKLWQFNLTNSNHTLSYTLNGNEFMEQNWTQKFLNFTITAPSGYHIKSVNATVFFNGKQLNDTFWTGGNASEYNGTVVFLNASQAQNYTHYLSALAAPSGSIVTITVSFASTAVTVVHHSILVFLWWGWILLILLLAAVIIIIFVWYWRRKKKEDEARKQSRPPQPPQGPDEPDEVS